MDIVELGFKLKTLLGTEGEGVMVFSGTTQLTFGTKRVCGIILCYESVKGENKKELHYPWCSQFLYFVHLRL